MAHKYHIHVGNRGIETIRRKLEGETVPPRINVLITLCDGKCDEELNQVTKPINTGVFQTDNEKSYLAKDREDLEHYLKIRTKERMYRFVAVDLPRKNLYLDKDTIDLVKRLEAENRRIIEIERPAITIQDISEEMIAERIRKNRERRGKAERLDYAAIKREKELGDRLKEGDQ
jgi:hypothetical protein